MSNASSTSSVAKGSFVSGYLKQKGLFSRYTSYFFVLVESTLLKYKTESSATAEEEIELDSKNVTVVQAEGISGKKYTIALFIKGRTIILRANCENDYKNWFRALQSSVADGAKQQQQFNSPASPSFASPKLAPTSPYFGQEKTRRGSTECSSTSASTPFSIVTTLEAVLDASIISDEQGVIVGFNKAAETLFGYKREEILGLNVTKLMPQAFARNHSDYMKNYNKTGRKKLIGIPRKFFAVAKDGTEIPVMLHLGEVPNSREGSNTKSSTSSCSSSAAGSSYSAPSGVPTFVAVVRPTASPTTTSENASIHQAQTVVMKALQKAMSTAREEFNNSTNTIMTEYLQLEQRMKQLADENHELLKKSMKIKKDQEAILRDMFFLDQRDSLELQQLFTVPAAFDRFMEFCKKEKCEETLLFLKETHMFSSTTSKAKVSADKEVEKQIQRIYDTFLSPKAPLQINTSAEYLASFSQKLSKKKYSNDMFFELYHDAQLTLNPAFLKFASSPEGKAVTRILQFV